MIQPASRTWSSSRKPSQAQQDLCVAQGVPRADLSTFTQASLGFLVLLMPRSFLLHARFVPPVVYDNMFWTMGGAADDGSLARAGKVRGQTPKVAKQDKKKKPRGRAYKRMQYNRRFVTAVVGFGKKRGPNSSEK